VNQGPPNNTGPRNEPGLNGHKKLEADNSVCSPLRVMSYMRWTDVDAVDMKRHLPFTRF
jgi:hypothetical protein